MGRKKPEAECNCAKCGHTAAEHGAGGACRHVYVEGSGQPCACMQFSEIPWVDTPRAMTEDMYDWCQCGHRRFNHAEGIGALDPEIKNASCPEFRFLATAGRVLCECTHGEHDHAKRWAECLVEGCTCGLFLPDLDRVRLELVVQDQEERPRWTLTAKRKELESAVRLAGGLAHGVLPIMGCVRVQSGEAWVEITATDGAGVLSLQVDAQGAAGGESWSVVVSPKTLAAALRLDTQADEAALSVDRAGRLEVDLGGGVRAVLPSLDPREFPLATPTEVERSWTAFPAQLAAALQTTATAAAADDETRSMLQAVHLAAADGRLQLTATDGRRVHRCWIATQQTQDGGEALIRAADAALAQQFLAHAAAHNAGWVVWCKVGNGRLALEGSFYGRWQTLTLRQQEGAFPNADAVIPAAAAVIQKLEITAADLAAAVLSVRRLQATDKQRDGALVRLRVFLEDKAVRVDSGEESGVTAYCQTVVSALPLHYGPETDPELLSAVLNAQFADEWLQSAAAAGGTVTLTLRGARQPVSLERDGAMAVVMPMTV